MAGEDIFNRSRRKGERSLKKPVAFRQVEKQSIKSWQPEEFKRNKNYRENLIRDFINILNEVEVIKNPHLRSPDTGEIISGISDYFQGQIFINPEYDNSPAVLVLIHELLHILFENLSEDETEKAAKLIYKTLKQDYEELKKQNKKSVENHPFKILEGYIPEKKSKKQPSKD